MSELGFSGKTYLADIALDFVQCCEEVLISEDDDDIKFVKALIKYVNNSDSEALQEMLDHCEVDEWTEMAKKIQDEKEKTESPVLVKVTKQSRKRDKKRKDDKRREYARHYCSPGTPRVKGDSEYVLPARRSNWKKFLKRKANHTVRHYKGELPKGNAYRRLDNDLWYWW